MAGKINGGGEKQKYHLVILQCTELYAIAVPINETINAVTFT